MNKSETVHAPGECGGGWLVEAFDYLVKIKLWMCEIKRLNHVTNRELG